MTEHDEVEVLREWLEEKTLMLHAIEQWAHAHGGSLCPPPGRADSYGDGMRDAKQRVLDILTQKPLKSPSPPYIVK